MRLCVILPVLDEERLIGGRLQQLARLGIRDVVVVDGGSVDRTRDIVEGFPGVRLLRTARGRAAQMNAGAVASDADVYLFLHADVALPVDAAWHVEHALADPAVVAGAFRTWTEPDRPTRLAPLLHLADIRSRYSGLPYGDQAIFVRAAVFHRLGGFPRIPLMEDLALSQKLRAAGRIRIVPARVRVSGRRFVQHPLSDTLLVNLFPALFRLGVPAAWLAHFYRAVR